MLEALIEAYTLGLQHGKKLGNKEIPKMNLNPVVAVKEVIAEVEDKTKSEEEQKFWDSLDSYNPYKAIKAIKEDK
jgi:hypothetical protein